LVGSIIPMETKSRARPSPNFGFGGWFKFREHPKHIQEAIPGGRAGLDRLLRGLERPIRSEAYLSGHVCGERWWRKHTSYCLAWTRT
jgi:hypothetical protein